MSTEASHREKVRMQALDLGFSLFGIADVTKIKKKFYLGEKTASKLDRAISLGKRLLDSIIDDIQDQPTKLYFHHYRQLNFFLDRQAFSLSSYIQEQGFVAMPIPASQLLDWKKHIGHLSHKYVGVQAGLGWIGRNNLLVSPELGSRFRLVTILTDMPMESDLPLNSDCGLCKKCLPTCPAKAIKETQAEFDHMACYEKLEEFRRSGVISQHICGICVKACTGPK
jgi:epoxyqueuosine reductase